MVPLGKSHFRRRFVWGEKFGECLSERTELGKADFLWTPPKKLNEAKLEIGGSQKFCKGFGILYVY
jgi:hypothetical protein